MAPFINIRFALIEASCGEAKKIELDSPKPGTSRGRRSSAIGSWDDEGISEKRNAPVHLFASPSHSDSALSSSTNSNRPRERRRKKKTIQETAFSSFKTRNDTKQKAAIVHSVKTEADESLSSPSESPGYTSTGTEDVTSPRRKPRKRGETFAKPLPPLRTNKIQDVRARDEIRRIRIDEGNESRNRTKMAKFKKNREEEGNRPSSVNSPVERSFTPVSENMSYREKIRDRFNTVKERAVESLSRPQSRSQSRLKLLMMKQSGTRMEDLLKKEEDEIVRAIEKHERTRLKWKEIYKEVTHIQHASHAEGYQFFADVDEVVTPTMTPTAEPSISPSGNSPSEARPESKVLTSEYLGIKDDWDLIEFRKPETADERNLKLKREEYFFCPSAKSVPVENKLEAGSTPINLEEEGFYVGNKIRVPKNMRNRMEQRILMSPDGRKWFGEDGEMISSPCPLKFVSTRLLVDDDMARSTDDVVFKPATLSDLKNRYMDLSGDLNYVLDIDVSSIRFTHHPLFSREHLIAQSLKELYVKYKRRAEMDNLSRLCGRLDALRRARDNLKNVINENGDNDDFKYQLRKYEEDIQEVRHLRNSEGRTDKLLLNKILATWKDLKQLREQQGYQNTTLKLVVKKTVSEDAAEEKKKWDADIKKDVHEIQTEREKEYEKSLNEYKEKYENWSKNKKKKLRIEERIESEDSAEKLSDTESVENSDSDKDEETDDEPKRPEKVNVGDIKNQVIETYKNCFRQPGEPELEIGLSTTANPDVTAYNNKEEQRRSAVKKTQIFIKLFYNGKEVCRSRSQPLSQKFNVTIAQRFTIRILEWPESLMIEIHEDTGPLTKNLLVSGIYLPFPDSFTTVQNSDLGEHEFSSKTTVSYNHSAVGSGYDVVPYPDGSEFNNRPVCMFTSGVVACRVGWAEDRGNILAPPEKFLNRKREDAITNLSEIFGASGKFDIAKLKDWAEKSKLDPNDPYNAAFFQYLQHASDAVKTDLSYFRLDPLQEDYDFCEEKDLNENVRLKLLRLRDLGEPEFRGTKSVPLNEKQIHKDIFKIYEKRISTPHRLLDVVSSDPLDGHRAWGKKYLEQVQQRVLKQCRLARQHKRLQDIISEETVPDIGTLGLTFMKWLRPKRPLRPVRKERKKITVQNLSGQEVKIVVNVVRAFEVPVRKDVDTMSVNESIEGFSLVNVRPFVEISFRGIKARTTAAEGANPTWNQDLQIPLHTKNGDFSPGSLQSIRDTLYLHLFDEMVVDLIEDESLRETNIHQRLERHWLAGMEIPFSTLYFNSRIEGTFKLYSPPVLLGYEREAHRRQFGGPSQEASLPQRDATYITLFITVQPALHPPEPFKERLESSEIPSLEKHLEGWQQEIASMFSHRKIKTLVTDITGKSVCVTRFIKPLPPPVISENEKVTPEMAARFVSMIPSIAGSTFFPGLFDIWLTSDQILRLLMGDSEDHAILLCSYFLHLGLKAYLLLGSGIPYGSTAYVLIKEGFGKSSEYFIWDPTKGQKYSTNDSFCPLQKIYCLIDDENIWANIQPEEAPRRTRFDLSKRADWFPAFGRNIAAPTGSVQPQVLDYRMTSKQSVEILQDKMEKRLRDNLMKWRKKNRTQWNRYCAAILRKLLPKLEEATWNTGDGDSPNHILELHHILASHKMCGFPINMPYTDMEAVTEAVKATGVHCNETEEVEFAVAVYIHPYPNDVLSVWIYVASLVKRR